MNSLIYALFQDYEMQSLLVELLMRVSNREKHGKQMKSAFRDAKWDSSVPPVDTILEMFFKISADQFTEVFFRYQTNHY